MTSFSGSESSVNGRPNFSSKRLWEATLSLLTPSTTAPFSRNCGKSSPNAHACLVQPAVMSLG